MRCVRPCPTGAVDHWFLVESPYSVAGTAGLERSCRSRRRAAPWRTCPTPSTSEALKLLEDAHEGMGGPGRAPESASKPQINVYTRANPAKGAVTGNIRITSEGLRIRTRSIRSFSTSPPSRFPYLEGQSVGVIPPGVGGTASRMRCGCTRSPARATASGRTPTTWPWRSSGSLSGTAGRGGARARVQLAVRPAGR